MRIDSQDAVMAALKNFRVKEYDWNSSGALTLRGDVDSTIEAIFLFSDTLGVNLLMALPVPNVQMDARGTVEMAFDIEDGKQLLLTFEGQGIISYIKVFEDRQTSVEGVIRIGLDTPTPDDFVELTELFDWITLE